MSEPLVFAIVCDVCNSPMGYFVPDTGMARCEACQEEHESYPVDPEEGLSECEIHGHHWVEAEWMDCAKCRVCGVLDC